VGTTRNRKALHVVFGTGPLGRFTAEALFDAHAAGRIRTAAVRGSDFFGPWEPVNGRMIFRAALEGRPVSALGLAGTAMENAFGLHPTPLEVRIGETLACARQRVTRFHRGAHG